MSDSTIKRRTRRRLYRTLYSGLFAILISGCQSFLPKPAVQQSAGQGAAQLAQIDHWLLKARVALQTKEDNVTATLDWQKQGQDFDFHLYGLFGATYAHLVQSDDQAKLDLPEDQVFYHQNAEQLLFQSMGWDFPIDALGYWVKGLPSGKAGEEFTRNKKGELSKVVFKDWRVEFFQFSTFSGYSLPKVIRAVHPQMQLKMVVKRWQIIPAT